jgi:hypothetical protein
MKPIEIKKHIVTLLSSARRPNDSTYTLGLTCRQICDRIEGLLEPKQDAAVVEALAKQVREQLNVLESEFEISSKPAGRKIYRMAPPSLIVETEDPLRAKYVGDRAYFSEVIELLEANADMETLLVETNKSISISRNILEARGISVQTEKMLFAFLPNPVIPTSFDLSKAEQICVEDITQPMEVYIPQRNKNFFDKRWFKLDEARLSEMSQLRRVKAMPIYFRKDRYVYIWVTEDRMFKLNKQQAILAMYRLDLDQNAARLLNLDGEIHIDIESEIPAAYKVFLSSYTEEKLIQNSLARGGNNYRYSKYLQVRSRHKKLFAKLLGKLGINEPLS